MTTRTEHLRSGSSRPRRRALTVVLVATILVTLALVARTESTGPALDPTSPAPDGLLALYRLVGELDATVDISLDPPGDVETRVFVPHDLLDRSRADAMLDWVADGGVLIVAGPRHRLHEREAVPVVIADAFGSSSRDGGCEPASAFDRLTIVHDDWADHQPVTDALHCFVAPTGGAWLVTAPHGDGTLVVLGSAAPFTNRWLDQADNAVLAASLLAPRPDARVRFVPRPPPGSGDATLLELVPQRAWTVLALLAFTAAIGVAARARRLGPPPIERMPPVLPAGELTTALAQLRQRAGDHAGAARQIRQLARKASARISGLPAESDPATLVPPTAAALRVTEAEVAPALVDEPVTGDDDLVAVAVSAARIHAASHAAPP